MLANGYRLEVYYRQNRSTELTPRQQRRWRKKMWRSVRRASK